MERSTTVPARRLAGARLLAFAVLAPLAGALAAGCAEDLAAAGGADLRLSPDLAMEEAPIVEPEPPDLLPPPPPPDLLPDPAGPPYPFVLVHGMAGFRNLGPIEYFYKIPDVLRKDGHDVWISRHDPINSSEVRGAQVLKYVLEVLEKTGKRKVNLIGHSQGGFDVRYVASHLGGRVASVVEIASPMDGAPIADLAINGTGPVAQQALSFLLNIYGVVQGFGSDARAQITQLTRDGARAFFRKYPDHPQVAYYSIAGRSGMVGADAPDCVAPAKPPFIAKWDQARDPLDVLFNIPASLLDRENPKPTHDGLVPAASARHGVFLGCIPADHMDEVNQLLADGPGGENDFDAVQFYRDLLWFIRGRGF